MNGIRAAMATRETAAQKTAEAIAPSAKVEPPRA
jgi:hypothetical protein